MAEHRKETRVKRADVWEADMDLVINQLYKVRVRKKSRMDLKFLSWEIGVSLTKGIRREADLEAKE